MAENFSIAWKVDTQLQQAFLFLSSPFPIGFVVIALSLIAILHHYQGSSHNWDQFNYEFPFDQQDDEVCSFHLGRISEKE